MDDLTYEERKHLRRAAEDARDACNRHYGPFVDVVAHPLRILALLDMADRAAKPKHSPLPAAPVAQEPVAYRLMRKSFDGVWTTDGRPWCDGAPDPDLLDDVSRRVEEWRVEYAYAAPVAAQAQHAISGYTHTVPDDCETLHWRGNILSMNELASVAQPAVGEEIHIHIEGQDVLTLPLASSGMDAPRFVVHVPAQAQPTPYVGSFLAALDKALALDRTESPWSLKKIGSVGERFEAWAEVRRLRAALEAPAQHSDDAAVDRFAAAMKDKLAQKRAEGRGGWEDK